MTFNFRIIDLDVLSLQFKLTFIIHQSNGKGILMCMCVCAVSGTSSVDPFTCQSLIYILTMIILFISSNH